MNNKICALVPMKGVSERLPGKNMKILNGKPLCYYILKELSNCDPIEKIVVDSNSEIIKRYIAEKFPEISLIDRPKELCGQMISIEKVIEYDISILNYEYFFQTFATAPFLSKRTIENSIKRFFDVGLGFDSLFSVTKLQKRLYDSTGKCINPNPSIVRNQDLPPLFIQNACFFMFSKDSFDRSKKRIGSKPYMYELNGIETIDIDYEFDFEIAEIFAKKLNKI